VKRLLILKTVQPTGTGTGNNDEKRQLASETWKLGTAAVLSSGTSAIARQDDR
jgi:hypothetical protein